MINNKDQIDGLLPPAELLERYEAINPGFSKELIKLIKNEQEHRHNLQKKYLMHYRLGQVFSSIYLCITLYFIFELINQGNDAMACIITALFGLLVLLAIKQYKSDRDSANIRNTRRQQSNSNNYRRQNYKRNNNR